MQESISIEGFRDWLEANEGRIEKPNSVEQAVYALARRVIQCYKEELDSGELSLDVLDYRDIQAIAAPSCWYGCYRKTIEERINESHLSDMHKQEICHQLNETNDIIEDKKFGFFISSRSYGKDWTDSEAQEWIMALCAIAQPELSIDECKERLGILPESTSGSLSQVVHPLRPEFPICNSHGDEGWKKIGVPGYRDDLGYLKKAELIAAFVSQFSDWWPKNHRYFDEYIEPLVANSFEQTDETQRSGKMVNKDSRTDQDGTPRTIALNTILYGPPGTGKTYNTTAYAVAICEDRMLSDIQEEMATDEKAVNQRFKELKGEGRIAFVTFHQSYGYEDFVEGIRPVLPCDEGLSDDGDIQYDVIDGIFKEMSGRAREYSGTKSEDESPSDGNGLGEDEVEGVIEQYASFVQESNDEGQEVPLKGDVTITAINHDRDGRPKSFVLGGSNTSHQWVSFKWARRDFADYCDGTIKSYRDAKASRGGNTHGNAGYLFALYKKMREFMESDDYEQQPKQEPKQEKARKNFVLIIDEINRGNISKVFGELITLLEDDKREGGKHPIGVMLPHSPEEFYVPSNLYVLGTMNTADRSIALMDTALRRRFDFVEMMPKQELASKYKIGSDRGIDCSVTVADLMEKMNDRIEALYDREHTIGHSYFMNIGSFDQLKEKFEREIIPLLQEYFYDDYGKIRLVLADGIDGVDEGHQFVKERDIDSALFEGMDSDLVPEKKIYEINADAFDDPLSYIKIYSMNEYRTAKE